MKTKLLLTSVLSIMVFASCVKDKEKPVVDPISTDVIITIGQDGYAPGSRAAGDIVGAGETVTIKDGVLYFINAQTTVTNRLTVIPPGDNTAADNETTVRYDELASAEGVVLKKIDGDAVSVYFFGNTPTSLPALPATGSINDILKNMITVDSQTDTNGAVENVSVYGTAAISDNKASLKLGPIVARIQIPRLELGGEITSFRLDGIFVNHFYHSTPMNGVPQSGDVVKYTATDPFEPNTDAANPTYYSAKYERVLYDWNATEGLGEFDTGNTDEYIPKTGDVWAYNVFGGGEVPHIIFVISNITATPSSGLLYTGRHYVNIRGFIDSSTSNALTAIDNGKTYTLSGGVTVNEDNLSDSPETGPAIDVDVDTDALMEPWSDVNVGPVF